MQILGENSIFPFHFYVTTTITWLLVSLIPPESSMQNCFAPKNKAFHGDLCGLFVLKNAPAADIHLLKDFPFYLLTSDNFIGNVNHGWQSNYSHLLRNIQKKNNSTYTGKSRKNILKPQLTGIKYWKSSSVNFFCDSLRLFLSFYWLQEERERETGERNLFYV